MFSVSDDSIINNFQNNLNLNDENYLFKTNNKKTKRTDTSSSEITYQSSNHRKSSEANNSEILNYNDDPLTTPDFVIKQGNTINNSAHNSSSSVNSLSNSNGNNSNYRAKQAYETLQKLEREKDDLYEL